MARMVHHPLDDRLRELFFQPLGSEVGVCVSSRSPWGDVGREHPELDALIVKVAKRDGWFVPTEIHHSALLPNKSSAEPSVACPRLGFKHRAQSMRACCASVWIAAASLMAWPVATFAAGGIAVEVVIQNPSARPIAGVDVQLRSAGRVIATATTAEDGRATLPAPELGTYEIIATSKASSSRSNPISTFHRWQAHRSI